MVCGWVFSAANEPSVVYIFTAYAEPLTATNTLTKILLSCVTAQKLV